MKVLWLVSWYPSPLSPFDGDFIQRHARAVARYCEVEVILVKKDVHGIITKNFHEEVTIDGRLTERRIYYKSSATGISLLDKYFSDKAYQQYYKDAVSNYITGNGKPDFVHLHVAMKAGLIALWLKEKYNIPYLLSEHWANFLSEAKPNLDDFDAVYKKRSQKIFNDAAGVTVVSKVLGEALKERFFVKQYDVIPNVVDTDIFYPAIGEENAVTRFIHISSLNYQKDPEHIIEAFALLKNKGVGFSLEIVGPTKKELIILVEKYELKDSIHFKSEVPQSELAKMLRNSDALILYSRFETFGCVLIEANACGLPVIVSDLKVFHEIVEEGMNGIFAIKENPAALADRLLSFINTKHQFNKEKIGATTTARYNYDKVGKEFIELYQQRFHIK